MNTVSSMHTFQFTVHLYDYEHANVCRPHMINLSSGTTMANLKKTTMLRYGLMRSQARMRYS